MADREPRKISLRRHLREHPEQTLSEYNDMYFAEFGELPTGDMTYDARMAQPYVDEEPQAESTYHAPGGEEETDADRAKWDELVKADPSIDRERAEELGLSVESKAPISGSPAPGFEDSPYAAVSPELNAAEDVGTAAAVSPELNAAEDVGTAAAVSPELNAAEDVGTYDVMAPEPGGGSNVPPTTPPVASDVSPEAPEDWTKATVTPAASAVEEGAADAAGAEMPMLGALLGSSHGVAGMVGGAIGAGVAGVPGAIIGAQAGALVDKGIGALQSSTAHNTDISQFLAGSDGGSGISMPSAATSADPVQLFRQMVGHLKQISKNTGAASNNRRA